MQAYYVSEWSLRRKAEIVDLPDDFDVHADYLKELSKERILSAFRSVHRMMRNVFQDIADAPERFKMPLVEIRTDHLTKYGYPPPETQTSKRAPYMFLDALINLLICGEMDHDEMIVDAAKLNHANKTEKMNAYRGHSPKSYAIRNIGHLYAQLSCYGLYLEGLKHCKPTGDAGQIVLRYPDNADVLTVLKWMADKAHRHDRRQEFMICHYRLLQDDRMSLRYGVGADYIADRTHTRQEQDCAYQLDAALQKEGLSPHVDNRGEAAGEDAYAVYYFEREKDAGNRARSNFKLSAQRTRLHLSIRLKSIQNCSEHLRGCSDEVRSLFIPGDKGCLHRQTCKHGQAYTIDGNEYWKCGCGGTMLAFQPRVEDISDYVQLVRLASIKEPNG